LNTHPLLLLKTASNMGVLSENKQRTIAHFPGLGEKSDDGTRLGKNVLLQARLHCKKKMQTKKKFKK
jgi:hypothetical protein